METAVSPANGKQPTKPAGNGNGKTPTEAKSLQNGAEPTKETPKGPSGGVEAALEKFNRMNDLVHHRFQVTETVEKLKGFRPEVGESQTTLVIADAKGRKFTTTNSDHIEMVREALLKVAEAKKVEFEVELTALAA